MRTNSGRLTGTPTHYQGRHLYVQKYVDIIHVPVFITLYVKVRIYGRKPISSIPHINLCIAEMFSETKFFAI